MVNLLQRLPDCVSWLESLGFTPAWQPLPTHEGGGPRPTARLAVHGEFAWFGLEGPATREIAQHAARQVGRRGIVGGILVLDPTQRALAIAVAGDDATLVVPLDAPGAVALATLTRLRARAGEGSLDQQCRYADVLRGQGVERAFFEAFRRTLDAAITHLPAAMPTDERHALALLQLTRVLFLYFVQAEGWLDGRPDFLAAAVDDTLRRRRSIQASLLRPLFFGTLNRAPHDRGRAAARFGEIPFLNGGLFDPHPLERKWRLDIPNTVWRDAFDTLFERFHFTVRGSDGRTIAPDMLGSVFEGVMDPGRRHASGTFYTPARLVHRLLDHALPAWLGQHVGMDAAQAATGLAAGDPALLLALSTLTILDPAAGSGAFLLGAMERLTQAHEQLGAAPGAAARAVLRRQLFGVDRNPAAVRLAELRLWLQVLATERAARPRDVAPLPNLDAVVRQGDMLLDPVGALAPVPVAIARHLGTLRAALVDAHGDAKRRARAALRRAEQAAADAALAQAETGAEREIRERLDAARACGLFGERAGLGPGATRALQAARQRRRQIRVERRRLRQDSELPWFHCESHFADVTARGGFDLVVGNPPWIRAEALLPALRQRLSARFAWWRPARGGPGFRHLPDLSVAFVERALEVVHPQGVVAFLVPAKLASTEYARAARGALVERRTLHVVAPLDTDEAAFDATVYPMALVVGTARAAPEHRVRVTLGPGGPTVPQRHLDAGPWILRGGGTESLVREVRARHPRLDETVRCALGVKTGADRLFLTDGRGIESELLRWAIRGRDILPFEVRPTRRLIWTHGLDGRARPLLPPGATRHFRQHLDALRGRSDYQRGPAWTLFRTHAASAAHRVVWADLAPRLKAAALGAPERDGVPLNTCLVAPMPDATSARRLAAWLNAPPLTALARLLAPPAASGFVRHGSHVVGALPLPATILDDDAFDTISHLVPQSRADALTELAMVHLDLAPAERDRLAMLVAAGTVHHAGAAGSGS